MIKNILGLAILFSLLISISCSDDDEKFKIIASDAEFNIDENPEPGDVIGKINISSESNDLVYNILKTSYWNSFSVNSNGEIIVKQNDAFDYEHNQLILGVIHVSNKKESDESHIMIFINDVNEIYAENFVMTMDEGVSDKQSLGFLQARSDHGSVNFELLSQTPENAITVDPETGEIFVDDPSRFTYDLNPAISGVVKISNDESEEEVLFSINLNKIVPPQEQEPVEIDPGVLFGDVIITNQSELDAFALNGYHTIAGSLTVDEDPDGEGIQSLEGLNLLETVQKDFIIKNCNSLTHLQGLQGLKRAFTFYLINNDNLINIDDLSNLKKCRRMEILDNDLLDSFCSIQGLLKDNGFVDGSRSLNKNLSAIMVMDVPPPPAIFVADGNKQNPIVAEVLELKCK